MLIVKFTTAYKKSYKLMKKRGKDLSLLDSVIEDLRQGKTLEDKMLGNEDCDPFSKLLFAHESPDDGSEGVCYQHHAAHLEIFHMRAPLIMLSSAGMMKDKRGTERKV